MQNNVNDDKKEEVLVFNSIEEAKAFFKPLRAFQNVSVTRNSYEEAKRKTKSIDVLKYVRANVKEINGWTDSYMLNAPYNIENRIVGVSNNREDGGGGCVIEDEPFRAMDEACGGGGQPKPQLGVADMTRQILWGGYHLSFNYTFGVKESLSITNVNTNLVGATPSMSWTPSTTQTFTNYPGSALIYFDVLGYQNYNIIVDGIGTFFTEKVHLIGVYNTNTGKYTIVASS